MPVAVKQTCFSPPEGQPAPTRRRLGYPGASRLSLVSRFGRGHLIPSKVFDSSAPKQGAQSHAPPFFLAYRVHLSRLRADVSLRPRSPFRSASFSCAHLLRNFAGRKNLSGFSFSCQLPPTHRTPTLPRPFACLARAALLLPTPRFQHCLFFAARSLSRTHAHATPPRFSLQCSPTLPAPPVAARTSLLTLLPVLPFACAPSLAILCAAFFLLALPPACQPNSITPPRALRNAPTPFLLQCSPSLPAPPVAAHTSLSTLLPVLLLARALSPASIAAHAPLSTLPLPHACPPGLPPRPRALCSLARPHPRALQPCLPTPRPVAAACPPLLAAASYRSLLPPHSPPNLPAACPAAVARGALPAQTNLTHLRGPLLIAPLRLPALPHATVRSPLLRSAAAAVCRY